MYNAAKKTSPTSDSTCFGALVASLVCFRSKDARNRVIFSLPLFSMGGKAVGNLGGSPSGRTVIDGCSRLAFAKLVASSHEGCTATSFVAFVGNLAGIYRVLGVAINDSADAAMADDGARALVADAGHRLAIDSEVRRDAADHFASV
jgi:hypothetical protein